MRKTWKKKNEQTTRRILRRLACEIMRNRPEECRQCWRRRRADVYRRHHEQSVAVSCVDKCCRPGQPHSRRHLHEHATRTDRLTHKQCRQSNFIFLRGRGRNLEGNWNRLTRISCSACTNVFRPRQTTRPIFFIGGDCGDCPLTPPRDWRHCLHTDRQKDRDRQTNTYGDVISTSSCSCWYCRMRSAQPFRCWDVRQHYLSCEQWWLSGG